MQGAEERAVKTTSERSLIGSVDYVTVERVAIREDAEAFARRRREMAIWVEPRSIVPISSEELVGIFCLQISADRVEAGYEIRRPRGRVLQA